MDTSRRTAEANRIFGEATDALSVRAKEIYLGHPTINAATAQRRAYSEMLLARQAADDQLRNSTEMKLGAAFC